ncbi:MAG: hypothetical protein IPJ34_36500 [Myxococcales bacterium]|nr:hypothetical protein [Myxococcales bacterium]
MHLDAGEAGRAEAAPDQRADQREAEAFAAHLDGDGRLRIALAPHEREARSTGGLHDRDGGRCVGARAVEAWRRPTGQNAERDAEQRDRPKADQSSMSAIDRGHNLTV